MFDVLSITFWSAAYILIILAGIKNIYENNRIIAIPYVATINNLSWELCALMQSNGFWGHVMWFGLDLIIFLMNHKFIKQKIQKVIYVSLFLVGVIIWFIVFEISGGMMISSFVIDLAMAIMFLRYHKCISVEFKVPVAIFKLCGDVAAGLYYYKYSWIVAVIAIVVFICNSTYLYLSIKERRKIKSNNGVQDCV